MTCTQITPQYEQISLLYDDGSLMFRDRESGNRLWASKEFLGSKYTGRFRLDNGVVIEAEQILSYGQV